MTKPIIAKQVIVVRTDIDMPIGKALAQVSHASMAPVLNHMRSIGPVENGLDQRVFEMDMNTNGGRSMQEWIDGPFTKVVLGVDSAEELERIYAEFEKTGLPCAKIVDEGRTVFKEPTLTCCGFGPAFSDTIDAYTGHLKLYRGPK